MALTTLRDLPAWESCKHEAKTYNQEDNYCIDRCGHNAVCVKEELLIWGGYYDRDTGSRYCDNKILWSYNLDLDSWYRIYTSGEIPLYRSGSCSVLVWPYWYVLCGHTHEGDNNDVYYLNLITLEWTKLPLPSIGEGAIPPRDKATAWVYDNRIYVYGGYGEKPFEYMWNPGEDTFTLEWEQGRGWNDQVSYLDLSTKSWVQPKIEGQKPLSRAAHASICVNGNVYIFGGRHRNNRMNDLHCLNLKTHKWSGGLFCFGKLPEGRTWHTLSQVSQTQLLLYGGFSIDQRSLDDAWLLNIETLTWSCLCPSTKFPRLWHTVSTNIHGDTLVFGGCENNILEDNTRMVTSRTVLFFRTSPFKLERLSLHCVYKNRERLRPQWECLPKQFQIWLNMKDKFSSVALPLLQSVDLGVGPNPSQLSMLSKSDIQSLDNNDQMFHDYLFHVF